jgi:hypothetical protein
MAMGKTGGRKKGVFNRATKRTIHCYAWICGEPVEPPGHEEIRQRLTFIIFPFVLTFALSKVTSESLVFVRLSSPAAIARQAARSAVSS